MFILWNFKQYLKIKGDLLAPGNPAFINTFFNFPFKFIFSFGILLIGIIILFLNFRHLLPEKIAKFISSPLTLNLIAYTGILFVYSDLKADWEIIFALLILFFIFLFVLNLMRIPIKKLFLYIEKMKEKEKKADLSHEKTNVKFLKGEIKNLKREKDVIKAEKRTAKKYLTKKNKLVGNKTPKILLMSFMIFFLLVVVGLFFVKQNFITGFVVDSIEDEEVSLKVFYSFFIIGVSLLTVFLNLRKFKKKK